MHGYVVVSTVPSQQEGPPTAISPHIGIQCVWKLYVGVSEHVNGCLSMCVAPQWTGVRDVPCLLLSENGWMDRKYK